MLVCTMDDPSLTISTVSVADTSYYSFIVTTVDEFNYVLFYLFLTSAIERVNHFLKRFYLRIFLQSVNIKVVLENIEDIHNFFYIIL